MYIPNNDNIVINVICPTMIIDRKQFVFEKQITALQLYQSANNRSH
jgi:hypothetical protein